MNAELSRDTFDPLKDFTRVLMQQGRVQIDADFNEQASILLHYMQTLARNLIGDHGGNGDSFKITDNSADKYDFTINAGGYYVQGVLCENRAKVKLSELPASRRPGADVKDKEIVYLDVWERHISHNEDDDIREKALKGPDTATRTKLVWQIRRVVTSEIDPNQFKYEEFLKLIPTKSGTGQLAARASSNSHNDSDHCIIRSDSRYRGLENQLYRVEVHNEKDPDDAKRPVTWKWSRDNGAVVFPIRRLAGDDDTTTVTVEHLGRDDRSGLKSGDWVEIVDDDYVLLGMAHKLLQVKEVRINDLLVVLKGKPETNDVGTEAAKHPLLRRWDQGHNSKTSLTDGGVINVEKDKWLELENGISIQFTSEADQYKTGDYWLIPARVATGDIEWPEDEKHESVPQFPKGVKHYYAPLAQIAVAAQDGTVTVAKDLRKKIKLAIEP